MNNQKKESAEVFAQNICQFTGLLTSNITLTDGTKSQILTFMPRGVNFEEIVQGLDYALCKMETILYVQHTVSTLKANKEIRPFASYAGTTITPLNKTKQ